MFLHVFDDLFNEKIVNISYFDLYIDFKNVTIFLFTRGGPKYNRRRYVHNCTLKKGSIFTLKTVNF